MKRFRYLVPLIILVIMFFSSTSNSPFAKSDMSGYEGFTDKDHVFFDMTAEDLKKTMDSESTFAVYFGFSQCPWCNEAMPVLNETAKEYKCTVGYVNTRKDKTWQKNTDLKDYDLVVEYLGDYLETDDEGIPHLYTPHVFFVRSGKVVFEHSGTIEGDSSPEIALSETEKQQLKEIYKEGFELMLK